MPLTTLLSVGVKFESQPKHTLGEKSSEQELKKDRLKRCEIRLYSQGLLLLIFWSWWKDHKMFILTFCDLVIIIKYSTLTSEFDFTSFSTWPFFSSCPLLFYIQGIIGSDFTSMKFCIEIFVIYESRHTVMCQWPRKSYGA